MLKAIIVDDEAPARSEMRYLLDKIKNVEVLGEAGSAEEALKLMSSVAYDVAFIDINMPSTDGIEMTERIGDLQNPPAVVFTTAYGEYAVKAFDLGVEDYLVKPVSEERLRKALDKVDSASAPPAKASDDGEIERLDRIPVTKQSKTIFLTPAEIYFVESQGEFTVIHSRQGRFPSSFRLKDFLARLDNKLFFRSHRSFVVNLDHVAEMVALYGGLHMLRIDDDAESEVPVSRRQTRKLKSLLGMT